MAVVPAVAVVAVVAVVAMVAAHPGRQCFCCRTPAVAAVAAWRLSGLWSQRDWERPEARLEVGQGWGWTPKGRRGVEAVCRFEEVFGWAALYAGVLVMTVGSRQTSC
jgi:hypothetical protein